MMGTPLLFGEVLFDCFEDGATILGGAPFNVAWHLQAFGCSPLLVSRVGDDTAGSEIQHAMQHWGMSSAGLQKDLAHATGKVQISLKAGEPNFNILVDRAFDHIQATAVPPCHPSLIYHGSLGLRSPESANALADIKRQHPAAPIFMDVNLRPPWWSADQINLLLQDAHWVKLNHDELKTLIDTPGDLIEKAAELQQQFSLSLVIVTEGEQGAFARDKEGAVYPVMPSKIKQVVDTVGAGDAFTSVCILGLLRQWDLRTTLNYAQTFASALVEQQGSTVHDHDFYQPFKMQWMLST